MSIEIHESERIFLDDLFQFMAKSEGNIERVYTDGKGIPTIGVGYALLIFNKRIVIKFFQILIGQ